MTTTTSSRLPLVDPASASGSTKTLLDGVARQLGSVPNFMRALANSPAALESFLGFNGKLHAGRLDRKVAERVALVLAETNRCQYCVSAHTALASQAGLEPGEIEAARRGGSADPKADAAVRFAKSVVENRGDVTSAELSELQAAGFDSGEVVEIIAHIGLNTLTNYLGKVGQIDIDFPEVALLGAGA